MLTNFDWVQILKTRRFECGENETMSCDDQAMVMTTHMSAAEFYRNCENANIQCVIGEHIKVECLECVPLNTFHHLRYVTIWSQKLKSLFH